jgi:hypothetical protein
MQKDIGVARRAMRLSNEENSDDVFIYSMPNRCARYL